MMKKLLSASLFAAVALSANAYEIGQYAYTPVAKYQITGVDLVQNGKFEGATGLENWTATADSLPATSTFMTIPGGPDGTKSIQVQTGMNSLSHGIYQKIEVAQGGTYVVSLKVKGALAGLTDLDMTGGNTNYINAYWNTDGALATVNGTNLYYGTNSNVVNEDGSYGNGVSGGYGFSFGAEDWTEAVFAVEAPANGYVIIDLRGLADGLTIANVECHMAEEVYDDRIALNRIDYFNKYLTDESLAEREYYEDFQAEVENVKAGIADKKSPEQMSVLMESLEGVWDMFVEENFENMMDIIPTTDGSSNTGNNSANWMNWTGKWNKLNSYNGKAPWKFNTDRWRHSTAAAGTPLGIAWQPGNANNNWYNVATLTATLPAGKYFWGLTGQGGMMTKNKSRWAASWAERCAETKLFFNGDTVMIDTLNPARTQDYILQFELTEEKEITLGIICNNVAVTEKAGFTVSFYDPVLYLLKGDGYTQAQLAYIHAFNEQLEALAGRIDAANGYCDAANDSLPWGKETLAAGAAEAQALYDTWAALDTTAILEYMDNDEKLNDTVMVNGVRFLNNNYITPFLAMNAPFSDMLPAIDAAEVALNQRIYSSSSKKDDLVASIAASEAMYADKLKVAFSSEDSLALVNQRLAMNDMVEQFKAAIDATTIVDINFDGAEFVEVVDPAGLADVYYTVAGAVGQMKFSAVDTDPATSTNNYELGFYNGTSTDSIGMLRVGNSEAVVEFTGAPIKSTDIVNIQFDLYVGNLIKCYNGYKVLTAEGDTICGLYFSKYSGLDNLNTFGVNYNSHISGVGSGSASNAAIAATGNKTSFDIVMDFGTGKMYCYTANANKKAYVTSEEIDIPAGKVPAQFVLYSNYNTDARRSWFDNLVIRNIAAGPVEGIESIEAAKPVGNGLMYNIMGQQILKPVKGQIYIQNGVKKIAK